MNQYDFTTTADAGADDIVGIIQTFGIAHLPSYLSAPAAQAAAVQARDLLERKADWVTPLEYSIGKSVRADTANLAADSRYHTLNTAFTDARLRAVADTFMRGKEYLFHHDLYVAYDIQGSKHFAHGLHYDRVPHLKFFLYLTDVTTDTGPMLCVPRSHHYAAGAQQANRGDDIVPTEAETRIIPDEYSNPQIRLLGSAGTLFVFTSDLIHSATQLAIGERLVARNRCIRPRHLEAVRRQAAQTP